MLVAFTRLLLGTLCRAADEGFILSDFEKFGFAPTLNTALNNAGFSEPTPIQNQAIPLALEGHDILGLAQTGTGKTLAFGLPLMERLLAWCGKPAAKTVKALVLAPTRELVNQIADSLKPLTLGSKLRIATVVGGQPIGKQIALLNRGNDILVATPGRLIDLMERKAVDLSTAQFLVLDEADQMLDMGFIHSLRRIAPKLGQPRQTMLFSATMPREMEELSAAYLTEPKRVQVAPPGKAADKIEQSVHFILKGSKAAKLREILSDNFDTLSLVFARTKHGAEKLMKGLVADGYNATSIHGNKTQGQRDRAIRAFKNGEVTILVATDVAARGIDIPGVEYVINYDVPEVPDNYVHRIGRTARAGREGQAVTFCAPEEAHLLREIQKLMKFEVPVASGESPFADGGSFSAPSKKRRQRNRSESRRSRPGRNNQNADRPTRKPREEEVVVAVGEATLVETPRSSRKQRQSDAAASSGRKPHHGERAERPSDHANGSKPRKNRQNRDEQRADRGERRPVEERVGTAAAENIRPEAKKPRRPKPHSSRTDAAAHKKPKQHRKRPAKPGPSGDQPVARRRGPKNKKAA